MRQLEMVVLKDSFGVCRFQPDTGIPGWLDAKGFVSITRTEDELSVVCKEELIPPEVQTEKNWRILKILGPLDFSMVGILAAVSLVLAEAGASIFAISTYDTDYILVKEPDLTVAVKSLSQAGYKISRA